MSWKAITFIFILFSFTKNAHPIGEEAILSKMLMQQLKEFKVLKKQYDELKDQAESIKKLKDSNDKERSFLKALSNFETFESLDKAFKQNYGSSFFDYTDMSDKKRINKFGEKLKRKINRDIDNVESFEEEEARKKREKEIDIAVNQLTETNALQATQLKLANKAAKGELREANSNALTAQSVALMSALELEKKQMLIKKEIEKRKALELSSNYSRSTQGFFKNNTKK